MRRIMVPLDGSTFAESALATALLAARTLRAELHLVQVHEWRLPAADSSVWLQADPAIDANLRVEEEAYLRGLADRCAAEAGVRVRSELIDGTVVAALADYTRDADIDFVIMTTHGRGGISRVWLGSVADALVRACDRPIVLVRPRDGDAGTAVTAPRRILVPLDGSDHSEAVIEHAVALGSAFDARFTLLHTLPIASAGADGGALRPLALEATRAQRRLANGYMEEVAARLRRLGFTVETIVRDHAVPALAILDEAERTPATLIAMATHGRGGWSRIALGSVADKVLRASPAPVLLYRPPPALLRRSQPGEAGPGAELSA
jgi:nucleotide-binding universal stress UspA family protein